MPRGDRGGAKKPRPKVKPAPRLAPSPFNALSTIAPPRAPLPRVPLPPPPRAKPKRPTQRDKQATIWAAEQSLLPWEVPKDPPARKKPGRRPSQDERYKDAIAAPVSVEARKKLAQTMTPERKRQIARTYVRPVHQDTSLLHALTETPRSIGRHLGIGAEVAGDVAKLPLESLLRSAIETSYQAQQPQSGPFRIPPPVIAAAGGAKAAVRGASELALGPSLTDLTLGEPTSKAGLALDLALLIPGTRLTRMARAAAEAQVAARGLRGAEKAKRVEEVFERVMEEPALMKQAVSKATVLRVPERKAAHEAIDAVITDPTARRVTKRQVDAHVLGASKSVAAAERKAAVADTYRAIGEHMRLAPEHPIPGFVRPLDAAKAEANLRQFVNPKTLGKGRPRNMPHVSAHPDANNHQVVGEITPEEWWARTQTAVGGDRELGLKLAGWYRELGPLFRTFFGDDADAILRGFAVSQANASPTGGLTATLRVRDKLLRGAPISENEISAVVKSIEAAIQGQPVRKGIAAKLSDFADSLEGKRTRTWTADDIRGGSPTAIDIHAVRDLGWVDPKILATLRARHGVPVAHLELEKMQNELRMIAEDKGKLTARSASRRNWDDRKAEVLLRKERDVQAFAEENAAEIEAGRAAGIVLDNPRSIAEGATYNDALRKYTEITEHLNTIGAWDKRDWTTADVQALGWSAIQRIHGAAPEDAMYAIERNTYSIALELLNGRSGLGSDLDYAAQRAITEEVGQKILPSLVNDENAFLRHLDVGPGGYLDDVTPSMQMQMVATPEQVDRIVVRASEMFDQWNAWGVRVGVSMSERPGAGRGRSAIEILSDDFDDEAKAGVFYHRLRDAVPEAEQKNFQGFTSFVRDGKPGIRIITEKKNIAFAKGPEWASRYEPYIQRAADDTRVRKLEYNHTNVEVRDRAIAEGHGGRDVTGFVPGVGGVGAVGDSLAAEARDLLDRSIRRHAGARGRVRRAASRLAEEEGAFRPGAFVGRFRRRAPAQVQQAVPKPPDVGRPVREGLRGIGAKHREQDVARSRELAARAEAAEKAMELNSGEEALRAARRELRGKLPTVRWGGMKELDPATTEMMINHITGHPDLKTFEKQRAGFALMALLDGDLPVRSDVKLLRQVFGKEAVEDLYAARSNLARLKSVGINLYHLPRSLMSTFDMSAPLRQGLVVSVRYPRLFFRNWMKMYRMAGSERAYEMTMSNIVDRPTFDLMDKHGLQFTDMGSQWEKREEAFLSNYAERIPVAGIPVRASTRAYTGFLNKTRADLFDHLLEKAEKMGHDVVDDNHLLDSIARFVNSATGRGDIKLLHKHMNTLQFALFSPRLLASRLNFMNPFWYASLHPFARKEAILSFAHMVAGISSVLAIAKLGGASVELDPRNSDFAKVKIGNTRFDILGGFQQPFRYAAQIVSNKQISPVTGEEQSLTGTGYGDPTRGGTVWRFVRSKLAPMPSLAVDWSVGRDFNNQPFDVKQAAYSRMLPLLVQDIIELQQSEQDWPFSAVSYLIGAHGVGVQNYKARPSTDTRSPYSSGRGGTSPYVGGRSGGSPYVP